MKRRAEFLVQKRDGRSEWLRSTKLARSIHEALCACGADEAWRALELATAVVMGLRQRGIDAADDLGAPVVRTAEIAVCVERVLIATGLPRAARSYAAERVERDRRRRVLGSRGVVAPEPASIVGLAVGPGPLGEVGGRVERN